LPESQFLVQARPESAFLFHASALITSGFLFSGLQICSDLVLFRIFALQSARADAGGCYIDFSGFSASRVLLAQERFLNTTCVTAGTNGGIQHEKQAGFDSWRRYLTAAPTLWLARAWC
jgi:hypothetical protein